MTSKELGVSADIIKSLVEMGIASPTEIQQEAIPLLSEGTVDFVFWTSTDRYRKVSGFWFATSSPNRS